MFYNNVSSGRRSRGPGRVAAGRRWFEISDIRGDIEANDVAHWQVSLKVGFTLDE